MSGRDRFTLDLVYFAVGCAALGIILAFITVFVSQHFGLDIYTNLWVFVIPVALSIFFNILFIELYRRRRRK